MHSCTTGPSPTTGTSRSFSCPPGYVLSDRKIFINILIQSFSIDPAITGMMGWLVQCFYAYRIYILSKRRILIPAIVFVLASVSLGFAIGSTYHAFTQRYFASFDQWAWGVYVWLGTAVGADLVLTGALVYYLRQNKSGTDESDENHNGLIEIIVRVTIENNLATGVTSIIHAGLFASMESNYHVIFNCESSSASVTRSSTDRL